MISFRKSDARPANQFRTDRFFKLHNYWFFATREGASVGPFDSRDCAVKAVDDYIEFAQKAGKEALRFFELDARYAS